MFMVWSIRALRLRVYGFRVFGVQSFSWFRVLGFREFGTIQGLLGFYGFSHGGRARLRGLSGRDSRLR